MPLDIPAVRGLLPRGGTILGSSRTNPFAIEDGVQRIKRNLQNLGVDALIAIGGEDTLGVATQLHEAGVNVVGVPKTIDNDLSGTDYTFGFDTAVNIATEAIDRLHTTAESHHRVLIVEVMGRHAGWIALHAGMAGGANIILIPEVPFDIDQVCRYVEARFRLHYAPIIVVSEGAKPKEGDEVLHSGSKDAFGHVRLGGVGDVPRAGDRGAHRQGGPHHGARARPARRHADGARPLAGHPVRPARDRRRRRPGDWGTMTALRGTDIVTVPLAEATKELKVVDPALYAEAEVFFGCTRAQAEPRCITPVRDHGAVGRVSDDALAGGGVHDLGAPPHLQLVAQVAHVELHGRLGDQQPLADLPVAHAHREQLEHLGLALGEHRATGLVGAQHVDHHRARRRTRPRRAGATAPPP